ncbi:amidase [Pseudomonas sp. Irchel s3h17]|uniref:amidase n=1 Tax=Pseudomonas sp. Irchel s3h17 TaxID=2009182 RepID=UPI000BA44A06|nr:amidase [Pseudomonas sp. Irchel s3h17]
MKMNPPLLGFYFGVSLQELGRRLRIGEFTSVELVRKSLEACELINPLVNAFTFVAADMAYEAASMADRELAEGIDRGPLHGIPVAVKDNIFTAQIPTTMGSAHYKGYVPDHDAKCVERLKSAGAVILGKTTTHEFAFGPTGDCAIQGPTLNPWDTSRMAGGSSCGSAVAVACGIVPIAIGTDTGGSVRIPAALTGVIGFKPSIGRISTEGVFPLSETLDHVGILANSAEDIALVLREISPEAKPLDSDICVVPEKFKLGWVSPENFNQTDPLVLDSVFQSAVALSGGNISIVSDISQLAGKFRQAFGLIQKSEAFEIHSERVLYHPELYQEEVLERLLAAQSVKGWEYVQAMHIRQELQQSILNIFKEFELLVMPTVPIRAPKLYQRSLDVGGSNVHVRDALLSLTSPWNLLGLPAISIPCGLVDGLPTGLQLVAAPGKDEFLIAVAAKLVTR